jgi:hypothetical protein
MPDSSQQSAPTSSILNRVVVVLTPFFALFAGSIAAWVGEHLPGVQLDPAQITALIVAVVSAALTMAVKWLHGWQRHEADLPHCPTAAVVDPTGAATAAPLVALAGESKQS